MSDRPLSIAFFSDSAFPIRNGVSVSIDALMKRLREMGHSAHLFAPRYPGHFDQDPNVHRIRSVMTPFAGGTPFGLPIFTREQGAFLRGRFDLVHVHTPWITAFVGMRWAHKTRVPVVATYHTLYDRYLHYVPWAPDVLKRWVVRRHITGVLNFTSHVICPSRHAERWMHRMGVRTPSTVIPTGVPTPKRLVQFSERERLGARPGQTIILTCSRLAPEKNFDLLIRSFAQAVRLDPSLVLWIAGDGPARESITNLIRQEGIGDHVRMFGWVGHDQLDRYYAAADIFLFTSVTETQGLVVLEAMSYGLPVIVCRGGGASAPIRNGVNGLKISTDRNEVASAILRVAHDEGLAARLCDGAKESARMSTVELMADRTLEVYRQAIGRAGDRKVEHARR